MDPGRLIATGLVAASTVAAPLHAEDFEGLYKPPGSHWDCDIHHLGYPGGALGFIDDTIYGLENTCKIYDATLEGDWTRVKLRCSGEGESYFDELRMRAVEGGLEFDSNGHRHTWESCSTRSIPLARGGAQARNGRWGSGFGMGWVMMNTGDDLGNRISLACNGGGMPENVIGNIFVEIAGQPLPPGPVTFIVDGARMSFEADETGSITIDYCHVCIDNFNYFLEMLASGRQLTVLPTGGGAISFSLAGSREAIGRYPACLR